MENNKIITKRFVIRKSLLGTNTIIEFTNKKGEKFEKSRKILKYAMFQ